MRLNTTKCKVMHIHGSDTAVVKPKLLLNGVELEVVDSYKYLGVELNTTLDWNQQWQRVKSLTNSTPFLLKQLRRSGFERKILVNVYRSLVLSHFNYSSPLLASTSRSDKHEMQTFQRRLLRIIGISPTEALNDHNIPDIETLIENVAVSKIKKVLADQYHPLNKKYVREHARSGKPVFSVPAAKTERYRNSIVPHCMRILRDGTANMYAGPRRVAPRCLPETAAKSAPATSASTTRTTPCQHCARLF